MKSATHFRLRNSAGALPLFINSSYINVVRMKRNPKLEKSISIFLSFQKNHKLKFQNFRLKICKFLTIFWSKKCKKKSSRFLIILINWNEKNITNRVLWLLWPIYLISRVASLHISSKSHEVKNDKKWQLWDHFSLQLLQPCKKQC